MFSFHFIPCHSLLWVPPLNENNKINRFRPPATSRYAKLCMRGGDNLKKKKKISRLTNTLIRINFRAKKITDYKYYYKPFFFSLLHYDRTACKNWRNYHNCQCRSPEDILSLLILFIYKKFPFLFDLGQSFSLNYFLKLFF